MAKYWMITNRDASATGLGTHRSEKLSFFTADRVPIDKFSNWTKQTRQQFSDALTAQANVLPLISNNDHERQKHVTLFVHGYNNDCQDAARRYQQITDDLYLGAGGLGLCVLFTWPSNGQTAHYRADRDDARASGPALSSVLNLLYDQAMVMQRKAADGTGVCKAKPDRCSWVGVDVPIDACRRCVLLFAAANPGPVAPPPRRLGNRRPPFSGKNGGASLLATQSRGCREQARSHGFNCMDTAKVSVTAHSMGNWVLQNALKYTWERYNKPLLVSLINQCVMVAADVDNDLFASGGTIGAGGSEGASNLCYRITALYTGRDSVLGMSAGFKHFGKPRLGRSGLDRTTAEPDNVWDVDWSALFKPEEREIHSAYFWTPKIQRLLKAVLQGYDRSVVAVDHLPGT